MENLGDDFSLSSDHGVIEPRQECEVKLHFRAVKVINVKKNIRIEVGSNFELLYINIIYHEESISQNNFLIWIEFKNKMQ